MKKLSKYIDCLGVLHLKELPLNLKDFMSEYSKGFLSRNSLYYSPKKLSEISILRKHLLSCLCDNKYANYIILDYAIQFSAQTYYFLISNNQDGELILQAKKCLEEDVENFVQFIEKGNIFTSKFDLPINDTLIEIRNIELDNKLLVYAYVKNLKNLKTTIITPGLGSILIGPFFKAIWGNNYENILYSRFKNQDHIKTFKYSSFDNDLYLVDDNIGSGFTTEELMALLKSHNLIGCSSVEYDWYLYDIISKGLSPYTKFNYKLYDKLTLINTRNHKFLDTLVNNLKNNPDKYQTHLEENGFYQLRKNDLEISITTGVQIAKKYLPKSIYKNSLSFSKQILKIYKGV